MKTRWIALLLFIALNADASEPSIVYDGTAFDDVSGGLRRGSTYLGVFRLQWMLERTGGTSAFAQVLNKHGGFPSDFAGDGQGVSNLSAPNRWRLEEAWVQQNFFGAQLSILAGRYDLGTEFYRLQSAGLFLNGSFGVGPEFSQSGRSGPSIFPNTTTGVRIGYRPTPKVVLRAAAFNGMAIAEASYLVRPSERAMPRDIRFRLGRLAGLPPYMGKISLGAWHYTNSGRSSGVYLLGDRTVYENGPRQLSAFGQFGIGDARNDRFARYFGAGVVMAAPFGRRNQDELGLAVAAARNSGVYTIEQNALNGETAVECTYLAPLNAHIALQPDVQYVTHPNAVPSRKNAVVMQLHFEISR